MSRRDLTYKWAMYGGAVLAVVLVQSLVLNYIRVLSVHPFLLPMLVGIIAAYEGTQGGYTFGLIFGVLCDITIQAPVPCFFTLDFVVIALITSLIAKNLIAPGFLCTLVVSAVSLLLTQLFYTVIYTYRSIASSMGVLNLMGREMLVSMVLSPLLYLLFFRIFRKTRPD